MQEDLYHLRHKKSRRRRVLVITVIAMLAAVVAVTVRQCGEKVGEELNKDYRSLEDIRSDFKKYEKFKQGGF